MFRSLRIRLLLAVGLVVAVSIGAFAVFSSYVARLQFERFYEVTIKNLRPGQPGFPVRLLMEHYRTQGSWADVEPLLQRIVEQRGKEEEAYLADAEGQIRPAPSGAEVHVLADGSLHLEEFSEQGGVTAGRVEVLGPVAELRDEQGELVGRVYLVPPRPYDDEASGSAFRANLNRWLMVGVVVAGLLALVATLILSQRIVRPVEELTRAARRMRGGDLSLRVREDAPGEVGELGRAFNSMADGLERIEQLRRGMVSDVAHELRTPLTNIRCQLESIQDGLVRPDGKVIDSLHEETMLLSRLIDDLQELAYAEAKQLELKLRPISVGEEIRKAVGAMRATNGDSGPPIEIEVPDLPAAVADPERMSQILRNLLQNAVTHTPAGGRITLSARALESEIEISVRDTGVGIDPEHLPNIFERFYRTDPSRDRKTGGAGLGLAIVKQLVQAQNGRVWAESAPGRGSTFLFTLPIAR